MKHWNLKRVLSLLLVVCMVTGLLSGVSAMAEDQTANYHEISTDGLKLATEDNAAADETETEEAPYADTDVVRVFVVLEDKPVLQQGYATRGIAGNAAAMAVSKALEAKQAALAAEISANVLSGETLNVHWNLTLAANAMSVDLPYGKMDEVEALKGVKSVMLVPQYSIDPREQADLNTISSGNMIGSYNAWLEGHTGAGSRIAIVDTGLDSDHPSFNSAAFDYSLLVTSTKNGKQIADYNLLTAAKINEVLPQLHAAERYEGLTGNALYVSSKIAFGFNYIDATLDITHDNDQQGDHGTHVAGIATANRYVENADGTYTYADNGVVGVAPDAQVVVMKVFGKNGGAYADDYIAAIEDAIVLDCDSVNLSLGSAAVGFTTPGEAYFDNVMDSLDETDTVVCMSAGNSGNWAEDSVNGLLFAEDSNTGRVGSPGAYENSLAVASADNIANTAEYFTVNGANYTYADGAGKTFTGGATCKSAAFTTLDKSEDKSGTEYDFVFIGDPTDPDDTAKYGGEKSDFANTAGKIVLVSRGNGVAFTDKQINADAAKAAAIIVYNNVDGFDAIYAACTKKLPFITIRLDQMKAILASATQDENGVWGGKLTVHGSGVYTDMNATGGVITMSSFSSWGVPGDLSLKPEITAPGGNIYSTRTDGTYGLMSGTSMASPSAAGQAAVVAQYIRENGLAEKAGLTARALAQSLMMGTAVPIMDPDSDVEYSPRRQGSGLGNVENAVNSPAYVTIDGNDDGKVKVEFGDDPARTGTYSFSFHVNNLTDKSVSYRLSASVLAPETVTDEESGTKFIAMNDVAVGANAVFTTDAAGYDLNGDGKLDDGDVMAILNHAAGLELLADASLADLNGDGTADEVDAQILNDILEGGSYEGKTLESLQSNDVVTVPANGSVQVKATLSLNEEGKQYMEENFSNGNYLEGYVYLNAETDAEGKLGVSQSIPFLAFWGNWTDSSMFDTSVYAEDLFNEMPHKYLNIARENYYNVKKAGSGNTFNLGVNLYANDDAFIADRTAVRAGDTLMTINYNLIRNAQDVSYVIRNAETGEVYFSKDYGKQSGAFYYTNGGSWAYTSTTKGISWRFTDNEGNALPNNTKLELVLTAVPEYYTADENGNYTGLGKGAAWETLVTVDNEAPAVTQMFFSSDPAGRKLINIAAQDNQYISAIQFLTTDGKLIGTLSPNQQTANEALSLSVNVASMKQDKVVVAVVDYAGNARAYELELGLGGDDGDEEPAVELNGFFAFNATNNTWARFEPDTAKTPETAAEADVQFASAEYVNGYTVACTTDGYLYVMQHGKFEPTPVCYLNAILIDMAYNKADGKLYAMAVLNDENGEPQYGKLVTVDMFTGELTEIGSITSDMMPSSRDGEVPQVLAISDDGTFYVINASTRNTYLYSFRLTKDGKIGELTNIGKTGFKANYLQSMAFDHSTGELYWAQFVRASSWARPTYKLVKLDLTTGAGTALSDLPGEMTGLYIVRGQGGSTGKTDKPEKVQLTTTSATLYSGNKTALEAFVTPWNLTDRSIVWSSSDEKIATVNANGVVTAVSEGTAVITAASKLDGTVKAECTITVMQNNTTLTGIVHNADGQSFVADIDVDSANYKYLTGALEQDYYSVVQTGDMLLASGDGNLYSLDAENGYAAKELCYTGDLFMSDMAYSPNLDLTLGTYGYYLMLVDPTAENGYRGLWNLQGAFTAIAGIAYAGHDSTYNYFYMLSASGTIHLIGIAPSGDGYTLSLLHTIVTDKSLAITGQHMYQSLYYDMETGWIYWARFNGEDSSSIIAINEETEEAVLRGTFDEAAWPVVGLFASKSGAMDLDRTGDFNFSETCTLAQTELSSQDAVALPAGSLPTLEH